MRPWRYITTMNNFRFWSPFVIAYVGGMVILIIEVPIGDYLGIYSPLLGYAGVEIYAGAVLGLVAVLASRTWRGVLTFVIGLIAAGETLIILSVLNGADASANFFLIAPLYVALFLGFLGVPIYLIVRGTASAAAWLGRASGG